jgi:hypothetical protein
MSSVDVEDKENRSWRDGPAGKAGVTGGIFRGVCTVYTVDVSFIPLHGYTHYVANTPITHTYHKVLRTRY